MLEMLGESLRPAPCAPLVRVSEGWSMMRAMGEADELIKVWFRFVPREGWLPQDREGLWAARVGEDTASVRNIPFLQDGVAEGDIVRFRTDADGVHWSTERVSASGNCTVRVLADPDGPLGRDPRAVRERLSAYGLGGEVFSEEFPLVAFTVPVGAALAGIKAALTRGEKDGLWHYEVGSGTDEWWNA